jgi:GTPase SAR1 family protein
MVKGKYGDARATIGVGAQSLEREIRNTPVKLTFVEPAGQEKYRCITASYLRDVHIALVCYDMNDEATFTEAVEM